MSYQATLDYARKRDETDPLRGFRSRFALPGRAKRDRNPRRGSVSSRLRA